MEKKKEFEYPVKVAEYTEAAIDRGDFSENCCISLIDYYGEYLSVSSGYYDRYPHKEYDSVCEGRAAVEEFVMRVTESLYENEKLEVPILTKSEAHILFVAKTGIKVSGKLWWLDSAPESILNLQEMIKIVAPATKKFKPYGNTDFQNCRNTEPRTW